MHRLLIPTIILFCLPTFASILPDGQYVLKGVVCGDNGNIRSSERITLNGFDFHMIQANVEGRPSLAHYWWGALFIKQGKQLTIQWRQLHDGNATNDQRNHTPFFVQFTTTGSLKSNLLNNMHLLPASIDINYLIPEFNHQKFTEEDITSRLAKDKHMGEYSTKITVNKVPHQKTAQGTWYLFDEIERGFGAPRHLLCGAVDAHMSMVLESQK